MAGEKNPHPTRIFKKPEELQKTWADFKSNLKIQAQDWPKIQYVGKEGNRMVDFPVVPYTMEGFERFCRENLGCVEQYFKNQDQLYNDFIPICSHIKKEIREQQIIGGLLGAYNPSITQRLNNLSEKQETVQRTTDSPFKWEEIEGNKEDHSAL